MGFDYFNGKSWIEISREERLFCCHLYNLLKQKNNMSAFIEYLNNKGDLLNSDNWEPMNPNADEWEVGYEVCFYRDFRKNVLNAGIKETEYYQKRTFDLCLFSGKRIVVIEAKAEKGFNSSQVKTFMDDKKDIPRLIKEKIPKLEVVVNIIGLISSKYNYINSPIKFRDYFDKMITWNGIYHDLFKDEIFKSANNAFGK
jgi:hypothetical protein